MLKILKNVELYAPNYLGKKNVLIANDRIEKIVEGDTFFPNVAEEDFNGKMAVPGFIDGHVHVIGGGGEGGFTSRIPEIESTKLLKCGVTSVIGLLGTDSVTRSLISLFAKIKALREEGMNAYMVTGSYTYPIKTVTGSVEKDIVLLDPVIGVGEVAISDHRSSAIRVEEIRRLALEAHVASMLSGKSGKIICHIGASKRKLSPLFEAVEDDEIEITSFLPTHVNRSYDLLKDAAQWIRMGGFVDLTACTSNSRSVCVENAVRYLLKNGGDIDHVLVSSDAQGSLPTFDKDGNFVSMGISNCSVLLESFKNCVRDGMKVENALKPFTVNVSNFFGLKSVGKLREEKRADLIFLNPATLKMSSIMVNGKLLKWD